MRKLLILLVTLSFSPVLLAQVDDDNVQAAASGGNSVVPAPLTDVQAATLKAAKKKAPKYIVYRVGPNKILEVAVTNKKLNKNAPEEMAKLAFKKAVLNQELAVNQIAGSNDDAQTSTPTFGVGRWGGGARWAGAGMVNRGIGWGARGGVIAAGGRYGYGGYGRGLVAGGAVARGALYGAAYGGAYAGGGYDDGYGYGGDDYGYGGDEGYPYVDNDGGYGLVADQGTGCGGGWGGGCGGGWGGGCGGGCGGNIIVVPIIRIADCGFQYRPCFRPCDYGGYRYSAFGIGAAFGGIRAGVGIW